jgi:hypothetical protein
MTSWAQKIIIYLVYINVIWDFISAAAIAVHYTIIAKLHTAMWEDENDQNNPAAQNLMGWFILTLGVFRLAAVLDPSMYTGCAILTYIIEGCFASVAVFNHSIKPLEGWIVALSSFAFAAALWMLFRNSMVPWRAAWNDSKFAAARRR